MAGRPVQAIARDVLVCGLLAARDAGFTVVGHCHDEILCEEKVGNGSTVEALERLMSLQPRWAPPTLMLAAAGKESAFYQK
jgi:DNA polymerase